MRALIGQAARSTARLLHRIAGIALAVLVLAAAGLGVLGWRLSAGPLDLPWLIGPLEAAANSGGGPTRITIGTASLAWEGFSAGVDRPLDIRLTNVAATDAHGTRIAQVPRAAIALSVGALLLGRIVPRAIEVDEPQLRIVRSQDGAIALDLGGLVATAENATPAPDAGPSPAQAALTELLAELSQPPGADRGTAFHRWSELRRVRIRDAVIAVVDHQLDLTWQAPQATLDLNRPPRGGLAGSADIALVLGDQHARLTAQAAPRGDGRATVITLQLTALSPASLAGLAPRLAPLAALDAEVTLAGTADLGADLGLTHLLLHASVGAGRVLLGTGHVPVLGAELEAQGTPRSFDLRLLRIEVAPRQAGPGTVLHGSAAVQRDAGVIHAAIGLDLDQVAFADLPALWPEGVGGPGARSWITANITDGIARDGHLELSLEAPEDLSDASVTSIGGGIDGHDLTVHWLRPVPPIEHGEARLSFLSPDVFEIAVQSGRQGALAIGAGKVRLSGLAADDQYADIDANLAGPLADAIALLHHPRLRLFDRRPLTFHDPSGQVAATLTISHLPLREQLSLDDIQIRAAAHLTDVHLGAAVAGRDLDHGALDLGAGNDGMKLTGIAALAGISAKLQADIDFRAGPPTQILEKITISGTADERQLADAGLDAGGLLTGPATIQAALQTRRDGHGEITAHAELTRAELQVARLNWNKPAGQPATADVHLLLDHEQLAGIDRLQIAGDGIAMQGQVDFAAGRPVVARLQRLRLGSATDAHGEVRWPARTGAPWIIAVSGPSIDATSEFRHGGERQPKPAEEKRGPPWTLDAQFDRVVLGASRDVTAVKLHGDNDGRVLHQARLTGKTSANGPFSITIVPAAGGRRLSGDSDDAGGLLRALDVVEDMEGGRITLAGTYDDGSAEHPLSGRAEIADFRMRNAPWLGKLLQAMTLYGLVDALQGPGLGFDRLVAPFRLTDDLLALDDARAYSASLGMTAKGQIDLARNSCDVQGTIVPAYFFNSLLGSIPFVGRLFSPERGGGLFAATYALSGNCDDPAVSVNPLAALTPGFLRGLFGIFQGGSGDAAKPPSAASGNQPRSNP